MMKWNLWSSHIFKFLQWCKETLILPLSPSQTNPFFLLLKKAAFSISIIAFAIGGAIIGTAVGAIKGQTTETGFVRGSAVGAITGAITAVQLLDLIQHGESFSKAALLRSLFDGKVLVDWVTPAVLKAYQWQMSSMEVMGGGELVHDVSEMFEMGSGRQQGLAKESIEKLTQLNLICNNNINSCCSICLENLKDGDVERLLPSCLHSFHAQCIDQWLSRQGSCPICRHIIL